MRADVVEALVDGGDAMRVGGVLRLIQQARALGVGGEHRIEDALLAARRLLRHVADARVARHGDRAHVGRKLAGDDLQERRLAGAVAADEADLVAGRDAGRRAFEDRPPLDAVAEIVDVQHGSSTYPLAPALSPWRAGQIAMPNRFRIASMRK